jgi:hypothetical protein
VRPARRKKTPERSVAIQDFVSLGQFERLVRAARFFARLSLSLVPAITPTSRFKIDGVQLVGSI